MSIALRLGLFAAGLAAVFAAAWGLGVAVGPVYGGIPDDGASTADHE